MIAPRSAWARRFDFAGSALTVRGFRPYRTMTVGRISPPRVPTVVSSVWFDGTLLRTIPVSGFLRWIVATVPCKRASVWTAAANRSRGAMRRSCPLYGSRHPTRSRSWLRYTLEGSLRWGWCDPMNRVITVLFSTAALLACDSTRTPLQTCREPGVGGNQFAGVIRATVARDGSRRLFRLPKVAASEIRPATDSAVCLRAARLLASMKTEPAQGPPHAFYVFHVGTSFAIGEVTPEQDADVLYFFDPEWRFLSNAMVQ